MPKSHTVFAAFLLRTCQPGSMEQEQESGYLLVIKYYFDSDIYIHLME